MIEISYWCTKIIVQRFWNFSFHRLWRCMNLCLLRLIHTVRLPLLENLNIACQWIGTGIWRQRLRKNAKANGSVNGPFLYMRTICEAIQVENICSGSGLLYFRADSSHHSSSSSNSLSISSTCRFLGCSRNKYWSVLFDNELFLPFVNCYIIVVKIKRDLYALPDISLNWYPWGLNRLRVRNMRNRVFPIFAHIAVEFVYLDEF